ncbi:DNA element excision controlling factor XisI homolog [Cylindrospermum sp. NIES-4074]|nr:DNA element excision controlling factor XisI homolog [Cylindrospermum sp. NIES-4074]
MRDFELALGQYILYRNLINLTEPEYTIYLAIKESTYENFFRLFSRCYAEFLMKI